MKKSIEKSLSEEIKKEENEKTSIQIRLFDDKTGSVFYKYLTQKELSEILETFDKMQWL